MVGKDGAFQQQYGAIKNSIAGKVHQKWDSLDELVHHRADTEESWGR